MRVVKCYECGKRYNYDEDGFCPSCGAFNQPPSLSRIAPDGSVVWVEGINSQNHEGSFVHKEYHTENRKRKGTALEQALTKQNPIRKSPVQSVIRQPLTQRDGTPTIISASNRSPKKKQAGKGALLWIFIVVVFLLNLLGRL